ncbi:DUF5361 domain-containing protein [Enterococcus sp. AZ196]|uniref:DUF5361 domain-containing protein n=1 Tax=Enterococcus sp. AZ196 TaxID=2774659 RepID=UPI003D2C4513
MIRLDEDALICDLAETYQIYDYKQLPALSVAVFSCGLREDSRIKMKIAGQSVSFETMLLAGISDRLSFLVWSKTKDAQKGKNRPTSIIEILNGKPASQKKEVVFDSSEDFERMRLQLLEGVDKEV